MPTTQDEKPGKPRTRSRKTSQQKKAKAGAKAQLLPDQVTLDAEPASAVLARLEDTPADITPVDITPVETAPAEFVAAEVVSDLAPVDVAPVEVAPETASVAVAMEKAQEEQEEQRGQEETFQQQMAREQMVQEAPLNGEVLPPEVRDPAPQAGLFAIAQAYGEYTRKSWLNGRFLVERLIAVRSFDEAVEIQGEFAKQAYTNFIVQSQKISVLYGAWTQQVFRPFEKFAAGWPRVGR